MEIKKYIAALLTSLMAVSTFVGAALAAVDLSGFPGFLFTKTATASTPAYLIVVGKNAAASDVAGAIDVASRLAEGSYTIEKVTAAPVAPTVEGKESKDIALESESLSSELGSELTATHVPALFRGELEQNGTKYTVVEKIQIPAVYVKTDAQILNGSLFIDFSDGVPVYNYTITGGLSEGNFSETKPLSVKLFGKEFKIKSIDPGAFIATVGVVGSASPTSPLVYGDYKIYSDTGTSDWAHIIIKDKADNKVGEDFIYKNEKKTIAGLDVKVTAIYALADGTILRVDLIVGPTGEVEKTYSTGDFFPGTDLWKFKITTDTAGSILYAIALEYQTPNETYRYLKLGDKIVAPNDYFEIGFRDLYINQFATITIKTGTVSVYESTTATTPKPGYSSRPAIILEADYPVFNTESSKKAYIVMNEGKNETALAYEEAGKAIYKDFSTNLTSTNKPISFTGKYDKHIFTINFTSGDLQQPLLNTTLNITDMGGNQIIANYTWVNNKYTLGAERSAEKSDVDISWEDISGGEGEFEFDAVSPYGTVVKSIKANANNDQVVIKLPAEQQKAVVYVGKLKAAAVAGGEVTYNKVAPIKTAVAKLDSEVGDAEKAAYHLVLVGGPCVNSLVADLKKAGKFEYGCADWPGENFALFEVIDDAFATGKVAVVIAGTRAEDTRLACSVAQNYDAYKDKLVGTKVKITGELKAPSIVPA